MLSVKLGVSPALELVSLSLWWRLTIRLLRLPPPQPGSAGSVAMRTRRGSSRASRRRRPVALRPGSES
jgi:hypothetical protein